MAQGDGKGRSYGPSISLTSLYERVSNSGNHFLIGWLRAEEPVIPNSPVITHDSVSFWNEAPVGTAAAQSGEQ